MWLELTNVVVNVDIRFSFILLELKLEKNIYIFIDKLI